MAKNIFTTVNIAHTSKRGKGRETAMYSQKFSVCVGPLNINGLFNMSSCCLCLLLLRGGPLKLSPCLSGLFFSRHLIEHQWLNEQRDQQGAALPLVTCSPPVSSVLFLSFLLGPASIQFSSTAVKPISVCLCVCGWVGVCGS